MLRTYKAQINKNNIEFIGDTPEELQKDDSFVVYVTILKDERRVNSSKETLVDFFRNSPLYDLELDLERDKDTGREVAL